MSARKEIAVHSRRETTEELDVPRFRWRGHYGDDLDLVFRRAFLIEPKVFGTSLNNCKYRVHERLFEDLSFLKGREIETFPDGYAIRLHDDGTRFLFSTESIPTFDASDRDWDGTSQAAVYCDREGINLIHCRYGYGLPAIEIYIGLVRAFPDFYKWLERLGCADRLCQ